MKQFLSQWSESLRGVGPSRGGRWAWPVGLAGVLALGSLACSEAPLPQTPAPTAGRCACETAGAVVLSARSPAPGVAVSSSVTVGAVLESTRLPAPTAGR